MPSPGRRVRGRFGGGSTYGATFLGAWESAQPYAIGDLVDRSGALYQCIAVHSNQVPPNASYWRAATTGGGSGDVTGPSSSVDSEVALFSGTTGKVIKRAVATGIAKLTSGVLSAVTTWASAALTGTASHVATFDGSGNPSSKAVGTSANTIAAGDDSRFIAQASATDKVLARTSSGAGPWQEATFGDDAQSIAALSALSALHRLRAPAMDVAGTWGWRGVVGTPFGASSWVNFVATSPQATGEANLTTGGTPTDGADDTWGRGTRYPTAASSGSSVGTRSGSLAMFRGAWNVAWACRFKLESITSVRRFLGITDTAFSNSDTPAGNYVALWFSTVAGHTNWMLVSRDNATTSSSSTGLAPVDGNEYLLLIWTADAGASWNLLVRDLTAGTQGTVTGWSTNIPSASAPMGYDCRSIAQAAEVKAITQRGIWSATKDFA